ncbi:MAG: aldo/keto reductase, partial [Bifidobacteriaceae bacterium]|nr:aldo/keto reductase [Bifidobacteriaceae bacterium]
HELFVCTKLRGADHGEALTPRAIDGSLAKLGVDYLDLYLIHWPLPQLDLYVDSWRAMDVARREGLIRSIGVSNFLPEHLDRLMAETGVVPAVNQIECHPYFTQDAALEFHAKHGIVTMAWSPLGRGKELRDPVVVEIAEAHGVTPAQVVLRWHIQRGCVPIPKSSSPARLRENLDVFGFELTEEEMGRITGLNRNSVYMDPATHDER